MLLWLVVLYLALSIALGLLVITSYSIHYTKLYEAFAFVESQARGEEGAEPGADLGDGALAAARAARAQRDGRGEGLHHRHAPADQAAAAMEGVA